MFVIRNPLVGSQPISQVSDTQQHPLGEIVDAYDPVLGAGKFIYLRGLPNLAEGHWVTYNADDGTVAFLTANAIGPVAISMGAIGASQFGWYQVAGKAVGLCLTGFVDNGIPYCTATNGQVDDAVVAGDRVQNAKGASARGTTATHNGTLAFSSEFEIMFPFVNDGAA